MGSCGGRSNPVTALPSSRSNRPEWHIADMAILSDGLVTVPVYATSAAGQVAYVLRHSGARLCVTDDAGQLAKVLLLRDDLPDLEGAVLIGDTFDGTDGFVVSFDDVRREGALRADIDPSAVERRSRSIRPGIWRRSSTRAGRPACRKA